MSQCSVLSLVCACLCLYVHVCVCMCMFVLVCACLCLYVSTVTGTACALTFNHPLITPSYLGLGHLSGTSVAWYF